MNSKLYIRDAFYTIYILSSLFITFDQDFWWVIASQGSNKLTYWPLGDLNKILDK